MTDNTANKINERIVGRRDHRTMKQHVCALLAYFSIGIASTSFVWSESAASSSDPAAPGDESIVMLMRRDFEHLILSVTVILLVYFHLRGEAKRRQDELTFHKQRLEADKERLDAEKLARNELEAFREAESRRFAKPAADIAIHLAESLSKDPHWARRALEAAKLLPYTNTLFDERSQHFKEEKQELARRFTPFLLKRIETIITRDNRDVWLLIDAGTTLYPFFEILGTETARCAQDGDGWLSRFHVATNNLPGIEQLIKTGRRKPNDRYSNLAIEDCQLLPGVPIPIFAAVAGNLTNAAVRSFREKSDASAAKSTFISLVVGNWVRLRSSLPRCPVPMARGDEHHDVKQTLIECSDEVFVVSPLGKVFVSASNGQINDALGYSSNAKRKDSAPYMDVSIDDAKAARVKLISTMRDEGRLLHRHSNKVEDALETVWTPRHGLSEVEFAGLQINKLPHVLFPFHDIPQPHFEQLAAEFPHDPSGRKRRVLEMFSVAAQQGVQSDGPASGGSAG